MPSVFAVRCAALRCGSAVLALVVGWCSVAVAQQPQIGAPVGGQGEQQLPEHPLAPAMRIADSAWQNISTNLKDYSATVVKRERINGTLNEPEYIFTKVRNEPFSVYMYFLAPEKMKGQECVYVAGRNDGNMFAHAAPGTLKYKFGTVSLPPDGPMAMQGQRYPITDFGIANLTRKLQEQGREDMQYGECEVSFAKQAKVNGRSCTMIQVVHPVPRRNFKFHLARIYLDDELNMPIRYEAYEWPKEQGGQPVLLEEYTYMNLKINQGFTDADFDTANPNYLFQKK